MASRSCSTIDGIPPTRLATIAFPAAIHSSNASGIPSKREERTSTSIAATRSGTWSFGLCPRNMVGTPSSPASRSRLLRSDPSPTTTKRRFGRCGASIPRARSAVLSSFPAGGRRRFRRRHPRGPSRVAAGSASPSPAGRSGMPLGMNTTLFAGIRSSSIMRMRSVGETATILSARRAISSRSTTRCSPFRPGVLVCEQERQRGPRRQQCSPDIGTELVGVHDVDSAAAQQPDERPPAPDIEP